MTAAIPVTAGDPGGKRRGIHTGRYAARSQNCQPAVESHRPAPARACDGERYYRVQGKDTTKGDAEIGGRTLIYGSRKGGRDPRQDHGPGVFAPGRGRR
ncbi:MAG: hypothetical protein LC104_11835 [Bacteroidales bacterium]|nr:hypothetical protein [Bacteroidales bacterium]